MCDTNKSHAIIAAIRTERRKKRKHDNKKDEKRRWHVTSEREIDNSASIHTPDDGDNDVDDYHSM